MRCPKCKGRMVHDDVHTHLGGELETRCMMCGYRAYERRMPDIEPAVEVQPAPSERKKAPCCICNGLFQYVTRGMCPKHYQRWLRNALTPEEAAKAPAPLVGQPQEKQESPWRKQLYDRVALGEFEAQTLQESVKADSCQTESDNVGQSVQEPVKPEKEKKVMAARRGTCVDCKRPDMAIQAGGRCGKCYYHAVKNGTVIPNSKAPKSETPAVPPPCNRGASRANRADGVRV